MQRAAVWSATQQGDQNRMSRRISRSSRGRQKGARSVWAQRNRTHCSGRHAACASIHEIERLAEQVRAQPDEAHGRIGVKITLWTVPPTARHPASATSSRIPAERVDCVTKQRSAARVKLSVSVVLPIGQLVERRALRHWQESRQQVLRNRAKPVNSTAMGYGGCYRSIDNTIYLIMGSKLLPVHVPFRELRCSRQSRRFSSSVVIEISDKVSASLFIGSQARPSHDTANRPSNLLWSASNVADQHRCNTLQGTAYHKRQVRRSDATRLSAQVVHRSLLPRRFTFVGPDRAGGPRDNSASSRMGVEILGVHRQHFATQGLARPPQTNFGAIRKVIPAGRRSDRTVDRLRSE